MNKIDLLLNEYKPQLAVMVYKSEMADEYYLESHEVDKQGRISAGKPLKQETIGAMVDVFFDERQNMIKLSGFMPENILGFEVLAGGKYNLIWYRPAETRVVHFAKQLKLPTGTMWIPPMIYQVSARSLCVYAFKKKGRPDMKTPLYKAPFFNVGDEGDVCLGNAKVKKPTSRTYESLMKYWEDLFWLSEFSHRNGDNHTRTNMSKLYMRFLKSKTKLKWSDIDELTLSTITMKRLFK